MEFTEAQWHMIAAGEEVSDQRNHVNDVLIAHDLFEPPPSWWAIITEIISDVSD